MGSTQREYSHNMRVGSIRHISRDGAAPLVPSASSLSSVSFLAAPPPPASPVAASSGAPPPSLPPLRPRAGGPRRRASILPRASPLQRLPPSPPPSAPPSPSLPHARWPPLLPSEHGEGGGSAARSCRGRITQSGREARRTRAPNPRRGGGGAASWRAARGGLAAAWPAGGE